MDEYRKYEPIFGSWKLERLIGKGSFGKVFEISREEYGTTYRAALKIISVPQDDDDVKSRMAGGTDIENISEYYESILKEIVNENEIMSKLKGNSNIVSYEDHQIIPHEDGIGYDVLIRMELLTPLLDRMMQSRLDEKEVVKLGIDICKALELCHKKNIIHRDIKPQNIFVSENGDFKLGDFGIARTMEKTTGGMSKKGTYKYMAPEVFRGENYDSTVDIYSLGIVLFSLLNGNRGPFLPAPPAKVTHVDEENARMRRFRGEEIPAPRDAGIMLTYIIKKACAANPADRYKTAEQMRRDLESYLANYSTQTEGDHAESTLPLYNSEEASLSEDTPAEDYTAPMSGGTAPQYGAVPPMSGAAASGYVPPAQDYSAPPMSGGNASVANSSYEQPRNINEAPRDIPQGKKRGSKTPFIVALAVILLAVGVFLVVKFALPGADAGGGAGGSGDCGGPPVEAVDPIRESTETEGVKVLSSDWDWDSSYEDDGNLYVYDILWVENSSDTPIVGMDFTVCDEDGNQMVSNNELESGYSFAAYGYIPPGQEGIMTAFAVTPKKVKHDDSTYKITSIFINESMGDYVVPTGKLVGYNKDNDSYDAEISNENDMDVLPDANVVAAEFKDGKIFDADATGTLNDLITAKEMNSFHKACFIDPNFYAKPKYENKTVYVIEIDKYGLDEM